MRSDAAPLRRRRDRIDRRSFRGLPTLSVDKAQLEAAILNLVCNSRDAMPKGGTILITASARQTRDPTLPNTSERPYICLSIRDDGSGIEADQQARVFEPFFTTKPIGRGSGLGLSQVFGFTAQSGGFTELQSELGKGTRVSLCFPHQSIEMPIDVLFVEDEDDLRSVVVEALTSQGFQVTPASNGDEALVLLRGDASSRW